MARPERHDADYFPFYAKDGRTLFILENKYGCKGTGFFTNVMRFLTLQPNHYICIKEETDKLYFFAKTKCDIESGLDMLDIMSETSKINRVLWVRNRVIASQDLLDSLTDAYKNRKNKIITIDEIEVSYQDKEVSSPENPITYPDKPQRKGKERKGKERKGTSPEIFPENSPPVILSEKLLAAIRINTPEAKQPDFQKWAADMDKLMRLDKIPVEKIEKAIDILPGSWWGEHGVIQSADKFRKKFTTLITLSRSTGKRTSEPDNISERGSIL